MGVYKELDLAIKKAKTLIRIKTFTTVEQVSKFLQDEVWGFNDTYYVQLAKELLDK